MRKLWSLEKIIEDLRGLEASGTDLRPARVRRARPGLFAAATAPAYFGSWRLAVEAAGLDYDRILRHALESRSRASRWSRARVLQVLSSLPPRQRPRIHALNPALYAAARRQFGSWRKAVAAADKKPPP